MQHKPTLEEIAEMAVSGNSETDDQVLERLSLLPPLEYERIRDSEAKKLKVRVAVLDALVRSQASEQSDSGSGSDIIFDEPDLLDEVIDGSQLIQELRNQIGRYLVRFQPIAATHALNLSAGVSNSRVLRGRSLSCLATALSLA